MSGSAETVISTDEGIFLIRDALADTLADQRAAALATRIPGHRGGRMLGAAGTVLQVRCAHQFSRPSVRIELVGARPQPSGGPWQWEQPVGLTVLSGRIAVDTGDELVLPLTIVPGRYSVLVGHTGREQLLEAATRVAAQTLHAGPDETHQAWSSLSGIEKYVIRCRPST
ncbi:hypothetical protein [Actinoplanes sp. HUAS TT8]|uniref:hypothetical protein n=1 Tax=Actinoplanes sp. HUAS TT8 TaxID=3447453 RepID=UPI003F524666